MRISEEIDALEVMGIKSICYLVSTASSPGIVVIIPLYPRSPWILSFVAAQATTTLFYGQSTGTYEHYFRTFLRPEDVFWSCDGDHDRHVRHDQPLLLRLQRQWRPGCVGEAVGISMRASLIAIALIVLLASLALYGTDRTSTSRFRAGVTRMAAP